MKKHNAELDIRDMSRKAFDYYSDSDWQVWKDEDGGLWYDMGSEEYGPYTKEELEAVFEEYAEDDDE